MIKQNKGRSSEGMDVLIHPSQTGCQKEKKNTRNNVCQDFLHLIPCIQFPSTLLVSVISGDKLN